MCFQVVRSLTDERQFYALYVCTCVWIYIYLVIWVQRKIWKRYPTAWSSCLLLGWWKEGQVWEKLRLLWVRQSEEKKIVLKKYTWPYLYTYVKLQTYLCKEISICQIKEEREKGMAWGRKWALDTINPRLFCAWGSREHLIRWWQN